MRRHVAMKPDPAKRRAWRARSNKTAARRRAQRARDLLKGGLPLPAMAQVSRKRMDLHGPRIRAAGSTIIEKGRGMAAAPAQQRKTRAAGGVCRIRQATQEDPTTLMARQVRELLEQAGGPIGRIDSAHVIDRPLGGCDDPLCTIPADGLLHDAYDEHRLSILDALTVDEQAHAVEHVGILTALKRATGQEWGADNDTANTPRDRLPYLSRAEQAEHVRLEGGILPALAVLTGTTWHVEEVIA